MMDLLFEKSLSPFFFSFCSFLFFLKIEIILLLHLLSKEGVGTEKSKKLQLGLGNGLGNAFS
jgi:hypothetical protein